MKKYKYAIIIFIILISIFQLVFAKLVYDQTINQIGEKTLLIANNVKNTINMKQYEEFLNNKNNTIYFQQMQDYFKNIQKTTNVKCIYVEHPYSNTKFEYIFDSQKNSLGETKNLTDVDIRALSDKNCFHTRLENYPIHGKLISGFSPLINDKGEIISTIGVDIDSNAFYDQLGKNAKVFLIYMGITTLLLILMLRHFYVKAREQELAINKIFGKIVNMLTKSLAQKSDFTWGHSDKVAKYARDIARELGIKQEEISLMYWAGLLHDIGKIGIPGTILNKPGKLTPEEYEIIKKHPIYGRDILYEIFNDKGVIFNMNQYKVIMDIVLYHHERWDGKGYPYNLAGENIPRIARILSVADCYEAMRAERPYKKPMSIEDAVAEIKKGAGTQFDPEIVEAFLACIKEGKLL